MKNPIKRRDDRKNLMDVSVEDLFEEFLNPKPEPRPYSHEEIEEEPIVRILEEKVRLRQDQKDRILADTCVSCYYSTALRMFGKEAWCTCTNSSRSVTGRYAGLRFWVPVSVKLECWRDTAPIRPAKAVTFGSVGKAAIQKAEAFEVPEASVLRDEPTLENEDLDVDNPDIIEDSDWLHARSQEILSFFLQPELPTESPIEEVPLVENIQPVVEDDKSDVDEEYQDARSEEVRKFLLEPTKDLSMQYRKKAMEKLRKYRKEPSIHSAMRNPRKILDSPVVSERISPIRNCQNCYYCVNAMSLAGSWWCACSHPGRSIESQVVGNLWVKSKIALPCWGRKNTNTEDAA